MNEHPIVPFSLEPVWAIEPGAFERLREMVAGSSHEKLAAAASASDSAVGYSVKDGVAIVSFSGVVTKNATIWSRIFGGRAVTSELVSACAAIAADLTVERVLLVIDSPGGTVNGTADAADAVAALNAVKPVTAFCEDMTTSAAYWIASQAGRVVGNTTAAVGSIGVFATISDISRLAKNVGIEVNVVKSVPGKVAGTMGAPVTEAQIAEIQREVDAIHALFVGAVSRGRGKNMSAVADGRVHIGQAAVDVGLLDAIEPMSMTMQKMKPKPPMPQPMIRVEEEIMPEATVYDDTGLKTSLQKLTEAHEAQAKELAALKTEKEIDAVIAAADPRKLTPGLVSTARTVAKSGGLVALNEFIASLPTTAPAGGSVIEDSAPVAAMPRHPADHVGGSLRAYTPQNAPVHQAAIDYMDRAEKAGRPTTYRDAVVAVTRKIA